MSNSPDKNYVTFSPTHVQYTQIDTNRQETLTNGTIGKRSPFVKEALRFVLLVGMESPQSIRMPFVTYISLVLERRA